MSSHKNYDHLLRQRYHSDGSGGPSITVTSSGDDTIKTTTKEAEEVEEMEHFFQRKHGWRILFYLPYDPVWEGFVIFVIIMDLFVLSVVVTQEFFDKKGLRNLLSFDLTSDLLVLVDNFLMICSRALRNMHTTYEYVKRPIWLICLNISSSVPDRLLIPLFGDIEEGVKYWLYLRDFIKMIHIIYYGHYRLRMVRHVRVTLTLCHYFMTMFGLYITIHYLFFADRCDFKVCDSVDRAYNLGNVAAALTYRLLCEPTTNEILIPIQLTLSYICYFGAIVPMVVLMVTALINKNNHEYAFEHKKQAAMTTLVNTNTPQIVKTKLADFFELHWQKQDGYNDADLKSFLERLAPCVIEELMVDMNFAAMKHSKLFQNMDLAFLRCVALEMEQCYLLPGETLCQKGSNKDKMIYVVSGIVQILSDRDGDTAVLSLSAGSCLGETTLIANYNSTATVVCKEYCVLQTLTMKRFVGIVRKFPRQMQRFRKMVWNRYGMAKRLKTLLKVLEAKRGVDQKEKRGKITWLNNTLHRLMMKDEDTLWKHMCQNISLREDLESNAYETMTSTASHLVLLAITERTELVTDSVFHHYTYPPILQPNSILLNVWDIVVCVLALFASCTIPIYSFVNPQIPKWYWFLVNFCTFFYIVDLYLRTTTAVKMKNEIIGNFTEIFTFRLGTLSFWFDMIAAYPFELHQNIILYEVDDMFYSRLYLNRCFKFAKILVIYKYYTGRSKRYKTLLTYIRYIVLITYLILAFGSIGFLCLCSQYKDCANGKVIMTVLWICLRTIATLLYMLGIAVQGTFLKKLIAVYLTCSIIAGTILVLLLATILSNEIMSSYFKIHTIEMYCNFKEIIDCLRIEKTCQRRILDYVTTQWHYDSAQKLHTTTEIFAEMPLATAKLFKEHMFQNFVRDMPLFKELPDEIIVELCAIAQVDLLPPKEIVYYKETSPTVIYYLIDGFVELVSGPKMRTIAGPGCSLSVFEAFLDLPQLNTCLTLTHCKLLSLPWDPVKLLIGNSDFNDVDCLDLKTRFLQFSEQHKTVMTYDLGGVSECDSFRYFGYNLKRDSLQEYDYYVPFDRLLQFSFIHYFLLRVTFLPNGTFVFWWELSRTIVAILSAVLFTVPPALTCRNCYWWWILLFLDLTTVLDIYLRCHYCYYNDKGLLVSHPLETASHYMKHAFVIDLIGVLPLRFFFKTTNAYQNKLNTAFHFTRSIQLYRTYYFIRQRSLVPRTVLTMARYLLAIMVAAAITSTLLINFYCDFHIDIPATKNYVAGVRCTPLSFYEINHFARPLNILKLYTLSLHFTSQLLANTRNLMYGSYPSFWHFLIEHILMIFGYCLYIYLVGKFVVILSRQSNLLHYQHELYLLKNFLKQHKIGIATQEEMIQHYHLQWEKSRGTGVHKMTERLHRPLRTDVIYNVYGGVLEISSVFEEGHRQFYKELLMQCKHETFARDSTICCVNDITSIVYILYEGCVKVIAPDGTLLTLLGVGSMFGNLDEYPRVRQTVGFVATENVQVLTVQSIDWYQNLRLYPKLYKTFKYLTVLHIDYLRGRSNSATKEDTEDHKRLCKCPSMVFNTGKLPYKTWKFVQLFIVCYLISILQIYMIAVIETNRYVFAILYLADILYVIDAVYVQYHTAYFDVTGRLITNRHLIRKKRNQNRLLWFVVFSSSLPVDLPIWFLPASWRLLLYLRLNRQLRLCHLFIYFETAKRQLTANHTFLRCATLVSFIVLLLQILNCCYIKVYCFDRGAIIHGKEIDCVVLSDPDGDSLMKCLNYLKHFIVISAFLLSANQTYSISYGFYTTFFDALLKLATLVVTTFMFAEIFCILRDCVYWRSIYEGHCCHLLNFMKRRDVSEQLVKKVWNYVRFFWKRHHGVTFPELLMVAPTPLKSKVLEFCYSQHIKKNTIFVKCHEDFVRQLVLTLKMDTYFPGDYVVFKGDINDCMYFIHKGSVLIMSEDTHRVEDIVGELIEGQSFGILQGLYPSTPHVYYYQAASNSDILCLNRVIWMYLLDYFPASKEVIYNAAESYLGF